MTRYAGAVATQTQKRKPTYTQDPTPPTRAPAATPRTEAERAKAKAETDAVLDGIEDILVENAEQFVNEYRQKGGQ